MRTAFRRHAAVAIVPVLAWAGPGAPGPAKDGQQVTVTLLEYRTPVPNGWTSRDASSRMRLAEYVLPAGGSDVAPEVVVYFFGSGQGGGVEANLERWRSQFSTPDGSPVYERVTHDSSGAIRFTVAEYRGTYARGVGTGSDAADARPNHTLVAVVAETPRGTLFFQLYGPSASVASRRNEFVQFAEGLRDP